MGLNHRAPRTIRAVILATVAILAPITAWAAVEGPLPAPATAADPSAPGPLAVRVAEYQGGPTVFVDPQGIAYPGEIHGVVHYPAPSSEATGPYPLVVYLHGNHGTCAVLGAEAVGYPCPDIEPVVQPVPNHRGYDYLGENLASHGYVTVSIDANAINTYNVTGDRGASERAQLIGRTLDHVAGLADGSAVDLLGAIGDDLVGRVDFDRIGLMGHSRGGEGVTTFLTDKDARLDGGPSYDIDAVLSLAGTDYNQPAAAGAHFATLLPLCDGDVHDLQSVFPNDRDRFHPDAAGFARHVFTVAGTNHNFYNSAWLNDDARTDGRCSRNPGDVDHPLGADRLTRAETEAMGITFVNGFMRLYVGDELEFESLLTGAAPLPASTCPGGVTGQECDALVGRTWLAPVADRSLLVTPLAATGTGAGDAGTLLAPITAQGFDRYGYCDPQPDGGVDGKTRDAGTASTCATDPYRSRADALTLAWTAPATWSLAFRADVSGYDALTFKAAANFSSLLESGYEGIFNTRSDGGTDVLVAIVDGAGRDHAVPVSSVSAALVPQAPDPHRELTLAGVHLPLAGFARAGVDLTDVQRIELRMGRPGLPGDGSIQLAELALQRTQVEGDGPVVTPSDPGGGTDPVKRRGGPKPTPPGPDRGSGRP